MALRVLYVGSIDRARRGTSTQRMLTLRGLGYEVVGIPTKFVRRASPLSERLLWRLFRWVHDPLANRRILDAMRESRPDILWIDKGIGIWPSTLRTVRAGYPSVRVVGFSRDDMMNPANSTRHFRRSLPYYHVFFTTKSFGVRELEGLGCPRAVFVANSFDPDLHRPVDLTPKERAELGGPVGFIGTAEDERAQSIAHLARNGVPVKVWGDGWAEIGRRLPESVNVAGPGRFGEDYPRVICSFDINLAFLRKCNRDLQTGRSVEIPACGAFMLAERTDEHLSLFTEGLEAEFFSDDEELVKKAKYYLAHPDRRQAIGAAGRRRCLAAGYSNHDRIREMLGIVRET